MRIALIGDTHLPRGARRLPERCLQLLRGAELIVHTGDFSELAVLEELRALGPPVHAVHGNVDSPQLRSLLPAELELDLGAATLAVLHDAGPARGRLRRLRARFPDADAVVYGHSHLPLHERDGDFQIFNPGSPTERRRAPSHTMGIAELRGAQLDFEHVELE